MSEKGKLLDYRYLHLFIYTCCLYIKVYRLTVTFCKFRFSTFLWRFLYEYAHSLNGYAIIRVGENCFASFVLVCVCIVLFLTVQKKSKDETRPPLCVVSDSIYHICLFNTQYTNKGCGYIPKSIFEFDFSLT